MSLEATGIYSLDLAVALDAADGIEVAVLNPKVVHRFAQTLRRFALRDPGLRARFDEHRFIWYEKKD